ncbi:hypothetical protein DFJ73DRAFT_772102 [Zopfochytrium polystomum]|nr:hypothetical protein DFJ73DRAFT_772102 [Zopfochytrium polystomum]
MPSQHHSPNRSTSTPRTSSIAVDRPAKSISQAHSHQPHRNHNTTHPNRHAPATATPPVTTAAAASNALNATSSAAAEARSASTAADAQRAPLPPPLVARAKKVIDLGYEIDRMVTPGPSECRWATGSGAKMPTSKEGAEVGTRHSGTWFTVEWMCGAQTKQSSSPMSTIPAHVRNQNVYSHDLAPRELGDNYQIPPPHESPASAVSPTAASPPWRTPSVSSIPHPVLVQSSSQYLPSAAADETSPATTAAVGRSASNATSSVAAADPSASTAAVAQSAATAAATPLTRRSRYGVGVSEVRARSSRHPRRRRHR